MNKNNNKNKTISLLKNKKIIKIAVTFGYVCAPLVLILFISILGVIGKMEPAFTTNTIAGGNSIYTIEDLPSDVTNNGIDSWDEADKQIFVDLENAKKYYDNDFKFYNASDILEDENEEFDLSTIVGTIHYQGVVDLFSYDETYTDTKFSDGEYNGETNVNNYDTRDFFYVASQKVGNNFMIYPSKRMLLGYLIANNVSFYTVEYEEWVCDSGICNNSSEIYSDWSYLGKITASNESDAKKGYSPTSAVENVEDAIKAGRYGCQNDKDEWLKDNYCYDTDMLFEEIFGEEVSGDIITYLVETYEAQFPRGDFHVGTEYIAVDVSKEINYDLYSRYLKDIYIPYVYINCDSCGYINETDAVKKGKISQIHDEIINFIEVFKYFNNETLIDFEETTTGGGTGSIPGVSYTCGDYYIGISEDYNGHNATDLTSTAPENPNVYPLMEGTVVVANTGCAPTCPRDSALDYVAGNRSNLPSGCLCGGGWGNYVKIQSIYKGKTIYATYAHLDYVNVKQGDKVTYATVLGSMGNTGVSTGRHLHIELTYTGSPKDKFPPGVIFSEETIKGTLCKRNLDSGDNNE